MSKREEAHKLLTSADGPEALQRGIDAFLKETKVAKIAADKAMKPTSQQLKEDKEKEKEKPAAGESKTIDGKTYVKRDGKWYEQ